MIYPHIFKHIPNLIVAQSTRLGGISPAPCGSLNLGINTADAWGNIYENRAIFTKKLGIDWAQVAYTQQVHGADILYVNQAGAYSGYDALVTDVPNIFVAIATADCAPILVFDPKKGVSAAIHAGWRGAAACITSKTLAYMAEHFGSNPADCLVYVGPCIGVDSFEVGAEVVSQFDAIFSKTIPDSDKFLLDLKAALFTELLMAGVLEEHIEIDSNCTFSNTTDFFSHRKEKGLTGRLLALIGLKI